MKLIVCIVAFSSACKYLVIENRVHDADVKLIVSKHNEVRQKIGNGLVPGQPRAVYLKNIRWDWALAKSAQTIANSCIYAHKSVTDSRFYVGQNLFKSSSTVHKPGQDWIRAIQSWFDENQNYTYPTIGGPAGHYTQIVWANTTNVGCGYSMYKTEHSKFKYDKLYVCNYGPGGNIVGEAPYRTK